MRRPAKTPLTSDGLVAFAVCATLSATTAFHFVNTAGVFGVHSAFFVPGDLDLWPWHSNSYERRTKHVFRVNLAQIRSAIPAIRCGIRFTRIERVSPMSPIWCINGRQTITIISGVSGPKFTEFLYDVDSTSVLLTRPSAFPYCHPNCAHGMRLRVPRRKACHRFRGFAPKIGWHGNIAWPIRKPVGPTRLNIYTNMSTMHAPLKIW